MIQMLGENKREGISALGLCETAQRSRFSCKKYISRSKHIRIIGVMATICLVLLGFFSLSPIVNKTNEADAASVASTTTITMTAGRTSANVNITPNDLDGTFATSADADSAAFGVTTNNFTGYTLKILGNDATGELANVSHDNYIDTISTVTAESDFSSNSTYVNQWGIKPSKYNSTTNTNYYVPAPVTTADPTAAREILMDATAVANSTANNYTVGLGAKVDYGKPLGDYSNTFTLAAIGNPATYKVIYSDGGITGITAGTMPANPTTGATINPTINLTSTVPQRTGYDFTGWCLGTLSGTTNNPGTTCTGNLITNGKIDINQTTNNEATVYATWIAKSYTVTKRYREQKSDGTYPSAYTEDGTVSVLYNNTTTYTRNATTTHQQASKTSGVITNAGYLDIDVPIKTFACTKQWFLQGTDGKFPSSASGSETQQVNYGATCSFEKTIAGYKGSTSNTAGMNTSITNSAKGSTSCTITTSGCTAKLYFYRNTWALTVSKGTGIASVSGAGTYMYGQSVAVGASLSTGYSFAKWTLTNASGTQLSTSASYNYSMPNSAATIYANAKINQYTCTKRYRLQNADGTWGGYTADGTQSLNYGSTCSYSKTLADYKPNGGSNGAAVSGTCTVGTSGCTVSLDMYRNTYALTVSKGTGIASVSGAGTYRWGQSAAVGASLSTGYSFAKWTLTNASGTQLSTSASYTYTMPKAATTIYANAKINQYTCTKRYRLQNANGTWGGYTTDGTQSLNYGSTCSYSKTLADYKPNGGSNGAAVSGTCTVGTSGCTVSLDMYRNTYALTVSKGTNISSVSGGGTYRWGQGISISATAAAGYVFSSWSISVTSGSLANANAASTTYTMPKGPSTVTSSSRKAYMHEFTKSMCSSVASSGNYSVTDVRDNQIYTVRYINGNCWMTRNLAIGCNGSGTTYGSGRTTRSLTSANSNVSTTWSTGSAYSLDKNDATNNCTTSNTSGCHSYTIPRMKCSSTYGAWYDFYTATAGTIYGNSNSTNSTYSICPAGWRLPSYSEHSGITSSAAAYGPVTGGYYNDGAFVSGNGNWWGSTADGTAHRYHLYSNGSFLKTSAGGDRFNGLYVRCIRSS